MNTTASSENISKPEDAGHSRRRFLGNAALAAGAGQFGIMGLAEAQPDAGPAMPAAGAAEQLQLFSEENRAAFKSLRL